MKNQTWGTKRVFVVSYEDVFEDFSRNSLRLQWFAGIFGSRKLDVTNGLSLARYSNLNDASENPINLKLNGNYLVIKLVSGWKNYFWQLVLANFFQCFSRPSSFQPSSSFSIFQSCFSLIIKPLKPFMSQKFNPRNLMTANQKLELRFDFKKFRGLKSIENPS